MIGCPITNSACEHWNGGNLVLLVMHCDLGGLSELQILRQASKEHIEFAYIGCAADVIV